MCYTGVCKYEGCYGDCILSSPGCYPADAACARADEEIEKAEACIREIGKIEQVIRKYGQKFQKYRNGEYDYDVLVGELAQAVYKEVREEKA